MAGSIAFTLPMPPLTSRKSGQLVKAFVTGGSEALETAIKKLGPMMYWGGQGELITRQVGHHWGAQGYRGGRSGAESQKSLNFHTATFLAQIFLQKCVNCNLSVYFFEMHL